MSGIESVFFYGITSTVIILLALIAIFFLIRILIKDGAWPKWCYFIWAIATFAVIFFTGSDLINIYLDMTEKDYITYHGRYEERGGGHRQLDTIVIFDEDGNEIKLLHSGSDEVGEYFGEVIYGKRSKIIVEYSGEPKN